MIKINFQLVPTGVNEFAQDFVGILIGCKLPLTDPSKQDLFVISQGFYTELKGYDLQSTLYAPADGKPKLLDICTDAIRALQTNSRRIQRGAIYPGALAVDPKEFHATIKDITDNYPQVQEVILFGRRAHEHIGITKFYEGHNATSAEYGTINGGYYFRNYPGYIHWNVAIKLSDGGQYAEEVIKNSYSFRQHPHAPELRCGNGIVFHFLRDDGRIARMEEVHEIVAMPPRLTVYPVQKAAPILQQIAAGRVLFKRENEL